MALTELARYVPRHESRNRYLRANHKGRERNMEQERETCAQQLYVPNALPQTVRTAQATQIAQPSAELFVPPTELYSPFTEEEPK